MLYILVLIFLSIQCSDNNDIAMNIHKINMEHINQINSNDFMLSAEEIYNKFAEHDNEFAVTRMNVKNMYNSLTKIKHAININNEVIDADIGDAIWYMQLYLSNFSKKYKMLETSVNTLKKECEAQSQEIKLLKETIDKIKQPTVKKRKIEHDATFPSIKKKKK